LKRSYEFISDLENELLIIDCPGEYDELPIAVVADELNLKYERVRTLIKLGEIEATGRPAHERISRSELERITTIGVPELLRLGQEESGEIFEQAVSYLQSGESEAAERAHKRLEARLSWRGPYAPALLVGLELAKGDLDGAISSMKLIYEYEDPLHRMPIMANLGRLLRGMKLQENNARELCDQFILLTEVVATEGGRFEHRQPKPLKRRRLDELQRQAIYLATSVIAELRKYDLHDNCLTPQVRPMILEQQVGRIIRDAIYTALHAESLYERSLSSRMYVDMMRSMIPKNYQPVVLLRNLFEKAERDGRG
jgi:hypothetical protein